VFTGLVEEVGRVLRIQKQSDKHLLTISAQQILADQRLGDSIAVDGACQTITQLEPGTFTVEALQGTLQKTTLGQLAVGQKVNLERAMALGDRLGGHMVQGHIQSTGLIREIRRSGENIFLSMAIPTKLQRYCIHEGSIALQGVSLTIYQKDPEGVSVNIIPHTWSHTALEQYRPGDRLNVETDLIARHLETLIPPLSEREPLTEDALRAWGY
jgi:riboflavin synthase